MRAMISGGSGGTRLRLSLALALLFLLAACQGSGCYDSSLSGDTVSQETVVEASGSYNGMAGYGNWVSSGVKADTGFDMQISTSGFIRLCKVESDVAVSAVTSTPGSKAVAAGFTIANGDLLRMQINSPIFPANHAQKLTPANNVATYWSGSSVSSSNICGAPGINSQCWFQYGATMHTAIGGTELSGIGADTQMYIADKTGQLSFWFQDSNYDDNEGGYTVHVTWEGCNARDGGGVDMAGAEPGMGKMDVLITNSDPNSPSYGFDGEKDALMTLGNGQFSLGHPPKSGQIWLRVRDYPGDWHNRSWYNDNSGYYLVNIQTLEVNNTLSRMIDAVVKPIREQLDGVAQLMYGQAQDDPTGGYKRAVQAMVLLYIVLYALGFTIGLIEANQLDLVVRIVKLMIVLMLLDDRSWEFFNGYLFSMFRDGSTYLINATTGGMGDDQHLFRFLDRTVGQFFVKSTWVKLSALLVAFPLGPIYFGMFMYALWVYTLCALEAVIAFLVAVIALSLMICLAPIFIPMILFSTTRPMFENWIHHMFNFALQPVMLFAALMLMNEVMIIMVKGALDFTVCFRCWLPTFINLPLIGQIPMPCVTFWVPEGFSWSGNNSFGKFIALFPAFVITVIAARLTKSFMDFCPQVVAFITGAGAAENISTRSVSKAVVEDMKYAVGQDKASKDARKKESDKEDDKKGDKDNKDNKDSDNKVSRSGTGASQSGQPPKDKQGDV